MLAEFILSVIFGFCGMTIYYLYINDVFELLKKVHQHKNKVVLAYKYRQYIFDFLERKDINFDDLLTKILYLVNKKDGDSKEDLSMNNRALLNKNRKSLTIYYMYSGKQYQVIVPYDANHGLDMSNNTVMLINEDGTEENITQQSGVPYLVSAQYIGGKSIKVTNIDIDNDIDSSYEYTSDIMPGYCIEVNKTNK